MAQRRGGREEEWRGKTAGREGGGEWRRNGGGGERVEERRLTVCRRSISSLRRSASRDSSAVRILPG